MENAVVIWRYLENKFGSTLGMLSSIVYEIKLQYLEFQWDKVEIEVKFLAKLLPEHK